MTLASDELIPSEDFTDVALGSEEKLSNEKSCLVRQIYPVRKKCIVRKSFSRLVSSISADVHQDKRSITHTHPFLQVSKKCGCSDEMEKKMVTLLYHRYTNSESFMKFLTGQ